MPRGGIIRIVEHQCTDGQVRRIEPVYFREVDPQTDKRHFVRKLWHCGHCGQGDWKPLDKNSARALKALSEKGDGKNMVAKNTRMITKTYEMEDIKCPECKDTFSLQTDLLKEMAEVVCPYCSSVIQLEDEGDDEEEAED